MSDFWAPLRLSFLLAGTTTLLLLAAGLPLAYWLAFTRRPWRPLVHALVSLPLVLPPTVLGFYLLVLLSPGGAVGGFIERTLGLRLVFSFPGLVLGSMVFSLPFMVHPIQSALESLPASLSEAAQVLGKSRWETFARVLLPNVKPALAAGIVLSFAHTLGEFGVVLMIGGSIPDRTRTASIAIFSAVEALDYGAANAYALALLACTFPVLLALAYSRSGKVLS